jgi:hypothetical protein
LEDILKRWVNWQHLRTAETLNGDQKKNIVSVYFVHLGIGLREAARQFIMCMLSIVHAIFPWFINFKLLEMVISQSMVLHRFLPQHPDWKKLRDQLNETE